MRKTLLTTALLSVLAGCALPERQNLTLFSLIPGGGSDINGPANLPPPGYTGEYWVDTKGCIFIRTASAGETSWVPQVNLSRQPICDPTRAGEDIDPNAVRTGRPSVFTPEVFVDPRTGLKTETVPPVAIAESFVQIGLFSDPSRLSDVRGQFSSLGFPIVAGPGQSRSVILGPFTVQSALDDALQVAAQLGFPDAFAYQN